VPTRADAEHYLRELAGDRVTMGVRVERFAGLTAEIVQRAGAREAVLGSIARERLLAALAERELAIVKSRVPGISAKLSQQVVRFVQALRHQDFYKSPGVAETLDWAHALTELDARSLTPEVIGDSLGALLKYQDDIARLQGETLQKVLKEATSEN